MQLLGQTLRGILCSDRWRDYDCVPLLQRQVCWAHLKRNFDKLVQRGGRAKKLGEACLAIKDRVFERWHLFRGGGLTRSQLDDHLAPRALELLAVSKLPNAAATVPRRASVVAAGYLPGVVDVRGRRGRGTHEQPCRARAATGRAVPQELFWMP
jgi:hypothetical protein